MKQLPWCSFDEPRLQWAILRSYWGGKLQMPATYTTYLILWDAAMHAQEWFQENVEFLVGTFDAHGLYPGILQAVPIHRVALDHSAHFAGTVPPTDEQVIQAACQQLKHPIPITENLLSWQSVQEEFGDGFCVFYQGLFLTGREQHYLLTLISVSKDGMLASPDQLTPDDCVENDYDQGIHVCVPEDAFQEQYRLALGLHPLPFNTMPKREVEK